MRRSLLVALSVVACLMAASPAFGDNLNKMLAGLKHAHVYVEPGTPGTTQDTAGELEGQLKDGDNIVAVMLPANAVSGDLAGFARKVDQELGGNRIVGLAAGDQTVAYSALLPAGVADDLMHSAANVSTNSSETLSTFIQNVHNWQLQNPKQPASKSAANARKKSGGFPWWILGVLIGVVLCGLIIFVVEQSHRTDPITGEEYVHFRSPVRDDLERIANVRGSVRDQNLKILLTQVCTDVEAYFRKYCVNPADDTGVFRTHLQNLRKVLEKYVEVQDSPDRYYDTPKEQLLASGYEAVEGFEQFVLDSIHRGSRAELTEFHVNTDILSAKRFS